MNQPVALEISVTDVKALLDAGEKVTLLDCRQPEERAIVQLPDSEFIPMNELPERAAELEPYREASMIVYCHHGQRSEMVTRWLREQGFSQAQNMAGGIDAWAQLIDTTLPRY